MSFTYLEALDREERKPHENPAIGVLLCASKDDEVVEYALNRSLSPALIVEYQVQLPNKQLLQAKLHEFYAECRSIGRGLNQTLIPINHKHHTLRDMALRGLPV